MRLIVGLFYTFLFFSYLTLALFIVFHLLRYSLNRKVAVMSTIFFLTVFTVLVLTNATIFFSLPLDTLLPPSFSR